MAYQSISTVPVDKFARTSEIGIFFTRGGQLALDEYIVPDGEIFIALCAGTTGDIVVEGKDGNFMFFPSQTAGKIIPVEGLRVVTSGLINISGGGTILKTTTATGIQWYGGAK